MSDGRKYVSGYQRERKTNRLNMRISDAEMTELNRLSYEDDESVSQVVRKAIKEYVNNRKNEEVDE